MINFPFFCNTINKQLLFVKEDYKVMGKNKRNSQNQQKNNQQSKKQDAKIQEEKNKKEEE